MGADEAGTLEALRRHRAELVDPAIARHGGRIVKTMGDGLLVEFPSVVDATRCALAVQQGMAERNQSEAPERAIVFRIGINLGDVIVEADDIFGDGVNVAARLEQLAEPGGIVISQNACDSVDRALKSEFSDNGEQDLKNIERPVRAWSWPRKLPIVRAEGKPRLYVADFEGRSEEEARCAADVRDELRAHFARLTGLDITAERRDAHYVVEGGVRLASDRSRIFARLIVDSEARQIWSDRYDEATSDPFEILDRSVPRIAMAIRRRVAADDAERLADTNPDELSLEQLLAVAGVSFFKPTKAGWGGGGRLAEKALSLAPGNYMALAMAAAGLGCEEALYGYRPTPEDVIDLAFKRIESALRENSRTDMLHVTNSLLLLYGRERHKDAAAAAERSLELNSDFNMGYWMLGSARVFMGENEAGAQAAQHAVELDIRDPYVHLYSRIAAYGHLGAGRPDEAAVWFQKADYLSPGLCPNLCGLAVSQWREGDRESARHAIARLTKEEPDFRMTQMKPLPFRDRGTWESFAETMRQAGAPE